MPFFPALNDHFHSLFEHRFDDLPIQCSEHFQYRMDIRLKPNPFFEAMFVPVPKPIQPRTLPSEVQLTFALKTKQKLHHDLAVTLVIDVSFLFHHAR